MIRHETQLVIFDMDGLLIDSEPLWRIAEKAVMKNFGITITDDDCEKVMGLKINEVSDKWIAQFGINIDAKTLADQIVGEVLLLIRQETALMKGVVRVMDYFKEKKIPMCIASSSHLVLIEQVVRKFKLENYISSVFSGEFEPFGKPHPGIFLTAAKYYNIDPEYCLVFEDSVNGVKAAKTANMYCVVVPDPLQYGSPAFNIADLKLDSLEKLLK